MVWLNFHFPCSVVIVAEERLINLNVGKIYGLNMSRVRSIHNSVMFSTNMNAMKTKLAALFNLFGIVTSTMLCGD